MRLPRLRASSHHSRGRRDTRHHAARIALATAGAVVGAAGVAALGVRLLGRPRPLAGCVALVAGAGREGLGIEVARELGRHGARLALIGSDAAALDDARADLAERGMEAATRACDLSVRSDVDHAVAEMTARFGRIDLVVNDCTVADGAAEPFAPWAVVHTTFAVLPEMRARKEGHLVTLTNRFATIAFSEGLEADLRPSGIQVTTVIRGRADPTGARHDARRVVDAIQRRDRTLTLGWQARLARLAHGLSAPLASSLLERHAGEPAPAAAGR
jgi:short-subunit dehydrogenase